MSVVFFKKKNIHPYFLFFYSGYYNCIKCYHWFILSQDVKCCVICFVYLCKTCNYEGQCHEILRDLPSVCAKMLGVAVVKADCSGVGVEFLHLHSIWYKQNMANWLFSDCTHKVKSWLYCSPSQVCYCFQWVQLSVCCLSYSFSLILKRLMIFAF